MTEVATSLAGFYKQERRAGKSHAEARGAVMHAFGRRGQALDEQIARPCREIERELAGRPAPLSQSTEGIT